MKCYLDMDGVLTDIMNGICEWHGIPNPYDQHSEQLAGVYNIHGFLGRSRDEFWGSLPFTFWANLPVTIEAHAIVKMVEKRFDNVWLLTSPENHPHCVPGKMEWCRKHFPQFEDRIIPEPEKWRYAEKNTVLIDDYYYHVETFKAKGGHGILFPRLWNPLHHLRHDPLSHLRTELEKLITGV